MAPGTREFEPLGTMNVDRMDMKKLLGLSGEGKNGTLGYIYGHSWRRCLETRNPPTGGSSGTRAGSA